MDDLVEVAKSDHANCGMHEVKTRPQNVDMIQSMFIGPSRS